MTCPCPPRRWNNSIEPAAKEGLVLVRTPLPHPTHPSIGSWGAQGIYIGDELLGGGVLVKELEAILQLCKTVWPEGITCACTIAAAFVCSSRLSSDLHLPAAAVVFSPFLHGAC